MLIRMSFLGVAALMVLAGPAAAGRCSQPYPPVIKVDANTTKDAVASLRGDVNAFVAATDIYQSCLVAQHSAIDASQVEKERIAREFNAALRAFKATHPD